MLPVFSKYVRNTDVSTVVSLEKVKRGLQVYHDEDDVLLSELIPVAVELCEKYMKRLIGESTVTLVCDNGSPQFFLPYGDALTIESVKIDGVDSTSYSFNVVTQKFKVNTAYNEVEIVYKAGMTVLPASVERAIIYTISTIYNGGQDFTTGVNVVSLPLKSSDMLEGYRYYVS